MKLKVWWIPQVPMKAFQVEVGSVEEAEKLLVVLADYDLFQYENNIKPNYCNAGGLQYWDESENEWIEWSCEDDKSDYCGMNINEMMREKQIAN